MHNVIPNYMLYFLKLPMLWYKVTFPGTEPSGGSVLVPAPGSLCVDLLAANCG